MSEIKQEILPIAYDPFVLRQFSDDFAGTKLHKLDGEKFLKYINQVYFAKDNFEKDDTNDIHFTESPMGDFCKILAFKNTSEHIKTSVIDISLALYPFIRTGYSRRQPGELEVLSRWVELPSLFVLPQAEYVVCILYSRDQLLKEWLAKKGGAVDNFYLSPEIEYGIVAIMGTVEPQPDPMPPITMMRNALGVSEGGNGVPLDKKEYERSVLFWTTRILVK